MKGDEDFDFEGDSVEENRIGDNDVSKLSTGNLYCMADLDQFFVFQNFEKFDHLDCAKDVLIRAAKKDSDMAFTCFKYYRGSSCAKDVLMVATKSRPRNAFRYFKEYENESFAEEIWITAIGKDPKAGFDFYDCYEHHPSAAKILEMTARNVAIKIPFVALYYLVVQNFCEEYEWNAEVVEEAKKNLNEQREFKKDFLKEVRSDPKYVINAFSHRDEFSFLDDDLLREGLLIAAKQDPMMVLLNVHVYRECGFFEEIMNFCKEEFKKGKIS